MQTTIKYPVSCYGLGIHSGKPTCLVLKPAKANSGIVFVRTDVKSGTNYIQGLWSNVKETTLSTSIQNDSQISVSTIEHLMAAIWGYNIDNIIIEVDGPEIPIMDGSSKAFIFMLETAGIKLLNHPKKYLKILKDVTVTHKDCEIIATPNIELNHMNIDLTIDFQSKAIGKQSYLLNNLTCFKNEISKARSFGFIHELEHLRKNGLALGASLENAIGIDRDEILNEEGLRYNNEFARHKMLDMIGDLNTAGSVITGNFYAFKPSHYLNNEFLRKLFSDTSNYKYI